MVLIFFMERFRHLAFRNLRAGQANVSFGTRTTTAARQWAGTKLGVRLPADENQRWYASAAWPRATKFTKLWKACANWSSPGSNASPQSIFGSCCRHWNSVKQVHCGAFLLRRDLPDLCSFAGLPWEGKNQEQNMQHYTTTHPLYI